MISYTQRVIRYFVQMQNVLRFVLLGKGYTSILSRMLEAALNDNDMIKRFL